MSIGLRLRTVWKAMTKFKLIAGIALLIFGLYVLIGERMAGTSSDATLNARILVVRSPIDGELTLAVRNVGARIGAQERVATILDSRYDTARLLELERNQSWQTTDLDRINAQLQELKIARETLQKQSDSYQGGRIRQIQARMAEADATLGSAQSRQREADSALRRTTDLSGRGLQTAITLDRAKADFEVAEHEVVRAKERLSFLKTELESANQGVFLGDSYNDTPFSLQRIREIDLRAGELMAERGQIKARIAFGKDQISAERVRINRQTMAAVSTPAQGIVWDIVSESGEYVQRGQDLVRLIDCGTLNVTASVAEGVYNSLHVGSRAQLRLYGDNRVFNATIVRLGGSGAAARYANMAIAPSGEHLRRFDVALSIPDISAHADLACAVGRTGRLIFSGGPLASMQRFLTRFGF